jgi:hypothetical protein
MAELNHRNKTRRNRKNKTEGGKRKDKRNKSEGGNRRNKTRKSSGGASDWNKKVMEIYKKMKKEDPNVKLGAAMKRASELKKKGQL